MAKLRFDLYLATKMQGRKGREVIEETNYAKHQCKLAGLTYYSPTSGEVIPTHGRIDEKPSLKLMKYYVKKDDSHLDQCKALLLLTGDTSSTGCIWEAARMVYKNRRSFYVVGPKQYRGQRVNFTTIKATKIFKNVEQAVRWIRRHK